MKVYVAVMFIVTTSVAFKMLPEMQKNAEECAKEYKVDLSVFKPGEKPDMKLFENKEYQCFGKCLALKFGLVDDKGEPNLDNIKKTFNPDDALMEKIKRCAEKNQQDDICEKIFRRHECVMKSARA